MPVAPFLPALAAGAAVVGTGSSLYFGVKGQRAQEKALSLQKEQSSLQQARQRREAVRQARIEFANAQQSATNQGVSESSAAQGGLGSIFSQFTSNLSFLDRSGYIQDQASTQMGKAATYNSYSEIGGQVAKLGVFGEDKLAQKQKAK